MGIGSMERKEKDWRRAMTPQDENRSRGNAQRPGREQDIPRPYDTRDLDKLPRPTDEDPAYRSWWVL